MKTIRWGVVACISALVATLFVAPTASALGNSLSFTVTHEGAPATGGCVELFEADEHVSFDVECADELGVVTFPEVEPGDYEARFWGFEGGLAALWWGGAAARANSVAFTMPETGLAQAMDLPAGGSITGAVTGDSEGADVAVFSDDLDLVGSSEINEDGTWEVAQLPAGDYYVWYYGFNSAAGAWHRAGDAPDNGSRSLVSVDPGAEPEFLEFTPNPNLRNVYGSLNAPADWDSSTVCIGAFEVDDPGVVKTWECGEPGEPFQLVGLKVGQYYKFRVVDQEMPDAAAWAEPTETQLWVGNIGVEENAVDVPMLSDTLAQYLPVAFFTDVTWGTTGFWEISWMYDSGITTGYDDGSFRPYGTVKRQDMARFLYRSAGEPPVTLPSTSPFSDVPTTADAYPAIVWLGEQGITKVNPFHPNNSVTRKQMVMFLYRAAGEPPVTLPSSSPFKDVPKTLLGYEAIVWAKQVGITTGYGDGTFRPNKPVIRMHMAMFMHRAWQVPGD